MEADAAFLSAPALPAMEGEARENHIYKIVELVGTSEKGTEDAIDNAMLRGGDTLRHIRWFEIEQVRGHVEDGKVAHYQVTVKVGFTLD